MARKGRRMGGGGKKSMLGGGMGAGQGLLQQVQKLQADMLSAQEALKEETVEASVGGGMVSVVMTGDQVVQEIRLSPDVVDPDDVEMLQDLLVAAFNEATERTRKLSEERMAPFASALQGGMGSLGGLLGM
ncbi:MAG: YbaB/EbfC family nucleoid-associated protein [Chloroflexi bacterium]|nr:YbaB/EbfC family nucleoid-associated protein [Chloroflexota bacterium]